MKIPEIFQSKSVLTYLKIESVALGYISAWAFMRNISPTFQFHSRAAYVDWFDIPAMLSFLLLIFSLGTLGFCLWQTKKPTTTNLIIRKLDYSLLLLLASIGFFLCSYTVRWSPVRLNLIFLPIVAYIFAIVAYGELVARLRDKTLKSTLYWLTFFRAYPIWRPMGFFTLATLAILLYVLINYFFTPLWLFSIVLIVALNYFAAYLMNLSAEYERANADKISAERFKTELITNVSHDIKTPLTSIINYVNLLKDLGLQGKAADYVQVLDKKSGRLKVLIDDLLEASKAGTGNMKVDMQKINLVEIVGQVAGEFEDAFNDRQLTFVLRHPEEPIFAEVDSQHFCRILENLFTNVAKYSLEGTRVFAEIAPHQFSLQNTSKAPIEVEGSELTEQFIRGDRARQTDGSGLGLYIAKSLIELMGGVLRISIIGDLFRVEVVWRG